MFVATNRLVVSTKRWVHEISHFGGLPGGVISAALTVLVAWTFQHVDVLWRSLGWFGVFVAAIVACFFSLAGMSEWERYRYQRAKRKEIGQKQHPGDAQKAHAEIAAAIKAYREVIAQAIDSKWSNTVCSDVIRTDPHYWLLRPHLSWQFEEMMRPNKSMIGADVGGVQVSKLALAFARELDAIERKFGIRGLATRAEARALGLLQQSEASV